MCVLEGVATDAALYREASDWVPLQQGLNARHEPHIWGKSLLAGPIEHQLPTSLALTPCHLLL